MLSRLARPLVQGAVRRTAAKQLPPLLQNSRGFRTFTPLLEKKEEAAAVAPAVVEEEPKRKRGSVNVDMFFLGGVGITMYGLSTGAMQVVSWTTSLGTASAGVLGFETGLATGVIAALGYVSWGRVTGMNVDKAFQVNHKRLHERGQVTLLTTWPLLTSARLQ
jgi:hypothetical protein